MSSSSSTSDKSECFCGGFNDPAPLWPTHPLIYYTYMSNRGNQRGRDRKKHDPNCFVKAFRWYTQERNPYQKRNSIMTNTPNIKGFAMWLDEKYTEFLRESSVPRMRYTLKRTSTVEIDRVPTHFNARPSSSAKKFKTLKSPRKRRRKFTNSKEKGDILLRSNKSFEFILRPKNMSRATSECFNRRGSCCTNSTVTTIDERPKAKSRSLTSVFEKEVYSIPYDNVHNKVVKDKADGKNREEDRGKNTPEGCCSGECPYIQEDKHKDSVSCQCSEMMKKVDRHSQYQSSARYKNSESTCTCNEGVLSPPHTQNLQIGAVEQTLPPCKCGDLATSNPSTCLQNNDARNKTSERTNGGTQTSDYSINLAGHQTPLYMKIICSEKWKGSQIVSPQNSF